MLRTLRRLLGLERDRSREPLFGFVADEVEQLRELVDQPGWQLYLDALDNAITLHADALLASRQDAVLHESRGMILGLRRSVTILDDIFREHDEQRTRDEQRSRVREHADDPRRIALYGSPAFGRTAGR